jgi:hypothetical protein
MHAKLRNVVSALLARSRREKFLAEYVIRESRREEMRRRLGAARAAT